MSTPRFSPVWLALLLLPAFLAVGWMVGNAPTPHVAPPEALAPASAGQTAAERSSWTSFDQAMAESKRTGKPVMIDFNAEWCGPCQSLRREVFDDATLGPEVQSVVIPVSITDRSREDGANPAAVEALFREYRIEAFPTLVVISAQTQRVAKCRGFGGGERTMAWIKDAARSVR